MTVANPTLVFPEGDVQYPMQAIFNPPMGADCLGQQGRVSRQTSDLETHLGGRLIPKTSFSFDHHDRG